MDGFHLASGKCFDPLFHGCKSLMYAEKSAFVFAEGGKKWMCI
jgi:hypothetical protein